MWERESLTAAKNLNRLPQLDDAVCRQDPTKTYSGIDDAISTNDRARIENRVAADFRPIANYRAEFPQAGGNRPVGRRDRNLGVIQFHI